MLFCAILDSLPQKSNSPLRAIQGWTAKWSKAEKQKSCPVAGVEYLGRKLMGAMGGKVPIAVVRIWR
jgi:hypothetical protein